MESKEMTGNNITNIGLNKQESTSQAKQYLKNSSTTTTITTIYQSESTYKHNNHN